MDKLTKEQVKELNEISKLSADEQKKKLPEFLKKLSPEQRESLMKGRESSCVFCDVVKGEIESRKVYEDNEVLAVLDLNPANKGHTIIFPKEHIKDISGLNVDKFFSIVKDIANGVVKGVSAEGFNLYLANGKVAGQASDHFLIHIIPRFENDGINFIWDPKKISDKDFEIIKNNIIKNIKVEKVNKKEIKKTDDMLKKLYYDKLRRIP